MVTLFPWSQKESKAGCRQGERWKKPLLIPLVLKVSVYLSINELDLKFFNKFPFKETKMVIKVKLI